MIRLLLSKTILPIELSVVRSIHKVNLPPIELRLKCFSSTSINSSYAASDSNLLAKDVIVYKYDNPRYFKYLSLFIYSQFIFWGYIGHWTFTSLRDVEVPEEVKQDKDLPWWRKINLGEDKYRRGIGSFCFFFAFVIIFVGWTYILRSVKFLVAHKNGKDVSIVSYTPFGENRIMKVPIKCISAQESRTTAKTFLPLKVKNKSFFYILDMKGEFKNTKLYDQQIGLYRNF